MVTMDLAGQDTKEKVFKSISYHMSFIFIPWIRTGLQNPYGYGNSQIYLRNLEVKSK